MIDKGLERRPRDILVHKRPDGKRPGYWNPGGKSPGTSSSGGSRGGGGPPGGGDRQMSYSAPAPAPAPAPSPHRDPVVTQLVTTAKAPPSILATPTKPSHLGDTGGSLLTKKPEIDTGDAKEKYISKQYKKPIDIYDDADLEGQLEIDKIRAKRELQFNPNLSKDRQKALEVGLGLREPKQSSGIGSFLKNTAMALIPGLLPAKLGLGYRVAKGAYDFKQGKYDTALDKLGINRSNLTSTIDKAAQLRSHPKGMPEHLAERGFKTRDDTPPRDGDGVQPTLAQTVTQGTGLKEGQELLGMDDKQIQQIYQGRDLLKQTIESGMYQDRKLNMDEMKMLQGHMMKIEDLIQAIEKAQAPVNVAHGGRIDKPLMGRSRDI